MLDAHSRRDRSLACVPRCRARSVVVARKRTAELKNGRLAMIGVMSLVSAHFIPDSVPLLP